MRSPASFRERTFADPFDERRCPAVLGGHEDLRLDELPAEVGLDDLEQLVRSLRPSRRSSRTASGCLTRSAFLRPGVLDEIDLVENEDGRNARAGGAPPPARPASRAARRPRLPAAARFPRTSSRTPLTTARCAPRSGRSRRPRRGGGDPPPARRGASP